MTHSLLQSDRGGALVITLALMGMIAVVSLMALSRSNSEMDLSFNVSNTDAAFYVAEAGAKRAFVVINDENDWRDGYSDESFAGGLYTVTLIDTSVDGALDDTVIIRAEGTVRQAQSWVELWTAPEYYHPFTWGMFAGSGINFDQGSCTDSYNSDSGSYFETVLDDGGSIGTNGTITTAKSVIIGGDASTAIGGSITLGVGSDVLGDTTTTMDSVKLDIIPPEEFEWAEATSDVVTGMSGFDYTYDAVTKSLTTDANGSIVLQSGVYYFSEINLGQNSDIILAPGADVTIYVDGNITFGQYATVNDEGRPGALQVYSQSGTLQFDQYNAFYGAFYGPNSTIQYDQTTEVYGSLVADLIQLDKGACFHYDRDLARVKHNRTGKMLAVAWREL